MILSPLRFFAVSAACLLTLVASAAEPAIVTKARQRVGSEAALNAVSSIHYVGTLIMADPVDPTKQTRAAIDIIYQKPDQQRVRLTSDRVIETTGLDEYEGWQSKEDPANPNRPVQPNILKPDQLRRIRANTWETLNFFRGLESRGGKVEDLGPVTLDGVACQKVAYIHASDIVFYRYFEAATGRLLVTETENGTSLREEGEIVVDGVRFPKTLITSSKTRRDGKEIVQTTTINIEKVTVNESFPKSLFVSPMYRVRR
jgi:hypothetical protein